MRDRRFPLRTLLLLAVLAAASRSVFAQTLPPPPTGPVSDPAESAKVKIGPVFMQPNFGFKNVGLDNNVFNDPADPKKDWSATVSMGMLGGLRFGPVRFTINTLSDYVYFAKYKTERAIDGHTRLQLEIRTDRFRPWIAKESIKSHDRAGLEIDERAGRELPSYEAGFEYRPGLRLGTRVMVKQRKVDYVTDEKFRGLDLGEALDATYEEATLQLLYEISPLSSFRLIGEVSRARFDTATIRDSDDRAFFAGIEGKKGAGIEGFIDVGWRDRMPLDPAAPAYAGIVARASASVVLWDEVLVAFGGDRDIAWSYEDFYTFYIQQGASTTLTWRLHNRFELVGTGRHYWLDYEKGLDERAVLRTDRLYTYGGGFGFFVRGFPGTRLGLIAERNVRQSVLADRRFDTPRIYTTIGFSF